MPHQVSPHGFVDTILEVLDAIFLALGCGAAVVSLADAGFWNKKVDLQIVVQLISVVVCLRISYTTTKNRPFC